MRPFVWFDVDDVLVDTSQEIHRVMLDKTGKDIPVDAWPSMLFSEFYGVGKENIEAMRGWWRDGSVLEQARPFAGALDAVRAVAAAGHKVGFITARGWHPSAQQITEDLIAQNNLPVSELILLKFGESKKDLLAERASSIAGFVDDSLQHVQDVGGLGVPVALVRRAWNRAAEFENAIAGVHEFPGWMENRGILGYRSGLKP